MTTLNVDLGERSYPIYIDENIFANKDIYQRHISGKKVLIVTDDNVAPVYLTSLLDALSSFDCKHLTLPAGEAQKHLATVSKIYDSLMENRFDRNCTVVALGGGVIGDIAGFAAASYQRGVAFVQVPTTLLAQVDSSVGGKTGVNHPLGKNMIGAFHQPTCVIADTGTLKTLPERELRAGLAEVIKYGLINDQPFFDWIDQHLQSLLALDNHHLTEAVERCCANKAKIVAADERESGLRALLNLGHTFGHAIETAQGYGNWLHGEAIAAGMCLAAGFSHDLELVTDAERDRTIATFEKAGLPVTPPADMTAEQCLKLMLNDKKVRDSKLTLVLMRGIGESFLSNDFDQQQLRKTLNSAFN